MSSKVCVVFRVGAPDGGSLTEVDGDLASGDVTRDAAPFVGNICSAASLAAVGESGFFAT